MVPKEGKGAKPVTKIVNYLVKNVLIVDLDTLKVSALYVKGLFYFYFFLASSK